jgi:predicted small secreted protein
MKVFKKLFLTGCTVLLLSGALTACHTVHGVGQDVQAGGQAIAHAAS